jgi:hypothetical protein
VTDELDPREQARARRRDRDARAEARALMRPGMGKVFKQILDAQAKAARDVEEEDRRKDGAGPDTDNRSDDRPDARSGDPPHDRPDRESSSRRGRR